MLDNERNLAADEAEIRASEIARANRHMVDEGERHSFFAAVMEREASRLGFCRDKKGSRSGRPVFSKAVAGDWSLYWLIDDPRFFYYSPHEGRFAPGLYLRNSGAKKAKIEPGEILSVNYASVVDGFSVAYWVYSDFCQLERAVKAHLFLYGLVAPKIEEGIRKVLG